jgi:2-amino-4-hydroxy-6-hydroxymethyldihydropteridine diphosphokinase
LSVLSVSICGSILSVTSFQRIYLSLGSNLGDRAANLKRAVELLAGVGVRVLRESPLYETEPVDFLDQSWFLNCVVEAETTLAPRDLLDKLQSIERSLGSKKLISRGPRIVDLDVLFYDDAVIHEPGMEIPHPRLADRLFVLIPLVELVPDLRHPVLGQSAAELLAATKDRSVVRLRQPEEGAANR